MSASSSPPDDLSLLSRLERLDASTVSDADKSLRVLPAAIRPVSARSRLLGRAVTANARDDLLSVLGALRQSGPGDVLVVPPGDPSTPSPENCSPPRQCAGAWLASSSTASAATPRR
jgi:regulator of RNase E activity RraA